MRPVRLARSALFPLTLVMVAFPRPLPARASFPGANGRIVYAQSSATNGCPDILAVNADGSGKTKLTNCPEGATDPSWNAGATKVAFASTTHESPQGGPGPLEIYTMSATGSNLHQVTNDAVEDDDPSWNNSGSTIVEGRSRSGPDTQDVATVAAAGGTPTTILSGAPGSEADEPEFSPDGTKIVFQQKSGPAYDLFIMNADGSNPTALVAANDPNHNDTWPAWSADGTKIFFSSDRFGNYELFSVNADGSGGLQQLTDETGVNDIQPAPSPDGRFVAFTQGCATDTCSPAGPEGGGQDNGNIKKLELSTSTVTTVVATSSPEFSPDWGAVCSTNCPASVTRTVTIALKGALKAAGAVNDTTGQHHECVAGQKVSIQFNGGTSWKTVAIATTDGSGHYSKSVPKKSGKYRAKVLESTASGGNVICQATTSASRTYHVVDPRAFVRFFASSDPDHGGMSFLFDIKVLNGVDDCVRDATVQVQRQSGSKWVTVASAKAVSDRGPHTFGNLLEGRPARSGTYRAVAPKSTIKDGPHRGDVCKQATSKTDAFPP